jgi:hypothetical protein
MLKHNRHLKVLNNDLAARIMATMPGMASWSIPTATTTCGDCLFWIAGRRKTAGFCAKHSAMMNAKIGPAVPVDTKSCRFFEERGRP